MTDPANAFKRLSATEALRALYIDFEGEKHQLPVLLGVLRRAGKGSTPFVHQDVVDKTFASLGVPAMSLHDAVEKAVLRAEHGGRRIASWSEHDVGVVRTLRDEHPELVARFEARYVNALGVAKHWRNKLHGGAKPASGRLADYLALIGYPVPEEAAPGMVGETIRVLRHRLEQGLPLTAAQQARWKRLVEHNRHDCAGMRRVCIRATRELGATTSPPSAAISTVALRGAAAVSMPLGLRRHCALAPTALISGLSRSLPRMTALGPGSSTHRAIRGACPWEPLTLSIRPDVISR